MGFKQVFYALHEVFPQVDLRILKAVASQYSSDVDAAVEFVFSDVLPAVAEPPEAHYILQDIVYAKNDHKDSCTNGAFPEKNPSLGYGRPLYNKNLDGCSNIEDKVVINETRITPTVDYDQVGPSSVSATKPPIIDYEQSALTAFVNHCAMKKGNMLPHVEKLANQKHVNGNYNLLDSLASSGSMLPLYDQSPSDCMMKHQGKMSLKVPKAECRQDFSESDDLGNLFAPTEDGHASANLLCALNEPRLSELRDNFELQVLFEKEMPLKLSKSEDSYNLDPIFAEFHSNKVIQTMDTLPGAPTIQRLSESEDSYDLQVLFEQVPLRLSTSQRSHDISKSKDNYDFQVLLEENGNVGKELDLLHTAEITPDPDKSEDKLHGKPCATDTTTQVPRFLIQDEYQQSFYKLDNKCSLSELFASGKVVNNSLRTFEEKDNLHTVHKGEKHDFTNALAFTNICNSTDDFYLSELSSSTRNLSLSEDSEYGVRDESEKAIMCLNSADKDTNVPLSVHDMDKYEEYLEIATTLSYEFARINKLIADVTNSKEALSSLYKLTRKRMDEVELQEGNSRKAKQDAVEAHQGFVTMVENYNKLIENSKQSNDKKAEIVRGEKSSLTTSAQDIQSRISKLSADRDDVLTIVEEIKFELDARLATSIEEEAAAREHISQEEELALLVREEKEAEMESIMEESMKLQKEAEENISLKKILTDRGHIIDILQGEISSIHEKVVALKERTHQTKPQSALALVTTSSSATTSNMPECKTPPDRHWQFENQDNSGILTQEKMVGRHAKDHEGLSDDEWEMLETNTSLMEFSFHFSCTKCMPTSGEPTNGIPNSSCSLSL